MPPLRFRPRKCRRPRPGSVRASVSKPGFLPGPVEILKLAVYHRQKSLPEKAEVEEEFLGEIPDTRELPGDELDRQATAKQVAQLLTSALDETERTVFTLHYGEELPLDAITHMLALENASGAKAYIVSAKRKLSRWISQKKVVRP